MLFLSADVPWPPDGGGRIASLHVLEAFADRFRVDLIAMADPNLPLELEHLEQLCDRVAIVRHPFTFGRHPLRQGLVALRSLVSREPYRFRKFRNWEFASTARAWKTEARYDIVHHEQLGVTTYRDASRPATALVQNVESKLYELGQQRGSRLARTWAAIEGRKLRDREPKVLSAFDHVFVLSEGDRQELESLGVERVSIAPMPAPAAQPARRPPNEPTLLSLGSMSWFGVADGLAWFHDQVLPLVRARVPGVRWELVGPGAPATIRGYEREPGITVHGYVDDLGPIVAGSRVAIVPLRIAGGIRMKLLDLMAWGVPAVSTTVGAQGLSFDEGHGAYRSDDPERFAQRVVDLLTDDDAWTLVADRGRHYLARSHGRAALAAAIEAGVDAAIANHGARTAALP